MSGKLPAPQLCCQQHGDFWGMFKRGVAGPGGGGGVVAIDSNR